MLPRYHVSMSRVDGRTKTGSEFPEKLVVVSLFNVLKSGPT